MPHIVHLHRVCLVCKPKLDLHTRHKLHPNVKLRLIYPSQRRRFFLSSLSLCTIMPRIVECFDVWYFCSMNPFLLHFSIVYSCHQKPSSPLSVAPGKLGTITQTCTLFCFLFHFWFLCSTLPPGTATPRLFTLRDFFPPPRFSDL